MAEKAVHNRKTAVTVAAVILCAIFARVLGNNGFAPVFVGLIRTLLYISLYMAWGISIRRRVIQPQVRRCLSSISALMVFWFIVRTCKYLFVSDLNAARYLWYSYYFPLLFIPLLALFVAMSLGRPEGFRLPGWTRLLYIPASLLMLMVMTNDLHQLVFSFPADEIWTDRNSIIGPGYFAVFIWDILCAVIALGIILMKSRQSQQRRYLPAAILLCAVAYVLIYVSGAEWLRMLAGDVSAVQCLMYAGILESCLQTGIIPTNTGYEELFSAVSVGMQLTDRDYRVCYASAAAKPLTKEEMVQAENGGCLLDETTLLKSCSIGGGHAIWQEDISDLLQVKAELNSAREELKDRNEILREQYRKDAQRYRLEEQNRLYDLVQRETQKQLKEIDSLSESFAETEQGSAEQKRILMRILVLAAYIKRHKDMVISSDRSRTIPVNILEGALRESCSSLSLYGIGGNLYIPHTEALMPVQSALSAYDLFEDALELSLDTLRYYFVTVSEQDTGGLCLHINLECEADLSPLAEKYQESVIEQDDGNLFISLMLTKGGDPA